MAVKYIFVTGGVVSGLGKGITAASLGDEMRAWYAQRFEECDVRISNDENASQLFTFVTCSYTTYANERTLVYAQPAES